MNIQTSNINDVWYNGYEVNSLYLNDVLVWERNKLIIRVINCSDPYRIILYDSDFNEIDYIDNNSLKVNSRQYPVVYISIVNLETNRYWDFITTNWRDIFPDYENTTIPGKYKKYAHVKGTVWINTKSLYFGVKYIDMGLPSGTLWADRNIGARNNLDIGNYYAWGECLPKSMYTVATYEVDTDLPDIQGTQYDTAFILSNGEAAMPSYLDYEELLDNCILAEKTIGVINGTEFTSRINGNTLFFPCAGYIYDTTYSDFNSIAHYWTSTSRGDSALLLLFKADYWINIDEKYQGAPIRAIKQINQFKYTVETVLNYGFDYDEATGYYESNNKGINSSVALSKITFETNQPKYIYIEYINYAESGSDYGLFSKVNYAFTGNETRTSSNVFIDCSEDNSDEKHYFVAEVPVGISEMYVLFRKDFALSLYNDSLKFRILESDSEIEESGIFGITTDGENYTFKVTIGNSLQTYSIKSNKFAKFSNVTSLSWAFFDPNKLNNLKYINMSRLDTSKCTYFDDMLGSYSEPLEEADLRNFDLSSCESIRYFASPNNAKIDCSGWKNLPELTQSNKYGILGTTLSLPNKVVKCSCDVLEFFFETEFLPGQAYVLDGSFWDTLNCENIPYFVCTFSGSYSLPYKYYTDNNTLSVGDYNIYPNKKCTLIPRKPAITLLDTPILTIDLSRLPMTSTTFKMFYACTDLNSVLLPSTLTSIKEYTFYNCYNLKSITIPEGVTSIRLGAFYKCTNLTSVEIPNSVTIIGNYAFYNCSGLTSVVIGNSVKEIGDWAFYLCSGLTSVEIPNSVTTIGEYAFSKCSGLTSVKIPNSVKEIGDWVFYLCSGLTSVEIPNSVTSIGDYAFNSCHVETYICDNEKYLLLFKNSSYLKEVVIGNSVTTIGYLAFAGCSGLTLAVIGNSVTEIGDYAFVGCSSLTSVIIPNSVTTIGYLAFAGCSGLTLAVIGNSVTTIGYLAFAGCSGLTSVEIPNSVTTIGNYAFQSCSALTSVEIPNSVTTIGNAAFATCISLTSVVIPNSLTTIAESAFQSCSGLTSVEIPNSVTTIGQYAFYGCSALTSVEIPNSVTTIGKAAFATCISLTSVVIPNSLTTIAESAFYQCSGLTSVEIPNSVTTIGNYAFNSCSALTSVEIPDSVTFIGGSTFQNCPELKTIEIGRGITNFPTLYRTVFSDIIIHGNNILSFHTLEGDVNITCTLTVKDRIESSFTGNVTWNIIEED